MNEKEMEKIKLRVREGLKTSKESESYKKDLMEYIRQELKWPHCPICGKYADTEFWESCGSTAYGYKWICYYCSDEYGDHDLDDIDEDAEVFTSDFGIIEMEIRTDIWR